MSNLINSGDVQAGYWLAPITRKEAQGVYDEFATAINEIQTTLLKLDALLSFVCEKSGIRPEEFQEWIQNKSAELQASQPSPIVME